MYLLNTAGILHENPYTGDRIVKAQLLEFTHAPCEPNHGSEAHAENPSPPTQVRMTHHTTVAIKYLLDSRQRRHGSESDSEEEEDQDQTEEHEKTLSPKGSISSSADAMWLARLRLLSNRVPSSSSSSSLHPRPCQHQPPPILQARANRPETIRFGIKARRELQALQAAQGHRHVIALLGWTGPPIQDDGMSTAAAGATMALPKDEKNIRDLDQGLPAAAAATAVVLDTPPPLLLPIDLATAAPLLPSSQHASDKLTTDRSAMSLEAPSAAASALLCLPPEFEQRRHRRFSDSEPDDDDGSFFGESDIEDEDDDDGQESWTHLTTPTATVTRVIDQQALRQHYRRQPRIGGMLLPYMPLTLRDLVQSGWSKARPKLVWTCMQQILEGLDWIHDKAQFIHRDISAGNILVSTQGWMDWTLLTAASTSTTTMKEEEEEEEEEQSEMGKAKSDCGTDNDASRRVFCVISDFGCAIKDRHLDRRPSPEEQTTPHYNDGTRTTADVQQQENNLYTFEVGTRNYRAPELLFSSQTYGKSIDLWSAGVLFAELFLGGPLFDADTDIGLICAIVKVLGAPTVDNWPEFPGMPDYGKLNFQPREVTPLSTLLLGEPGKNGPELSAEANKEAEGPPLVPPTRATPSIVELISKLVCYSGSQRLSAREALDQLLQARASQSTPGGTLEEGESDNVDNDNDHVDIGAIQQMLKEIRRREWEEREDDGGEGFSFGGGGGRGPSDDDDDHDSRWAAEESGMIPRYRPNYRQPFVSQTEWVSDDEV